MRGPLAAVEDPSTTERASSHCAITAAGVRPIVLAIARLAPRSGACGSTGGCERKRTSYSASFHRRIVAA